MYKRKDVCIIIKDYPEDPHRIPIGNIVLVQQISPFSNYPYWGRYKEKSIRGRISSDFRIDELKRIGKL
jgi:hypothetical protein